MSFPAVGSYSAGKLALESDPDRAATVIRAMLDTADAPLRLPLGAEAIRNLTRAYRRALDDVEKWATASESADFPDSPLPSARSDPARSSRQAT